MQGRKNENIEYEKENMKTKKVEENDETQDRQKEGKLMRQEETSSVMGDDRSRQTK